MPEPKALLTAAEIQQMLGMPRSTFYDFLQDPEFPLPIVLGKAKQRRWIREEVEWYIRHRPRGEQPKRKKK